MYSAYKLNKQGDNIQPWCTPFPIWNQSVVPCPCPCFFLTHIQISQEKNQVVWYSHLFPNFEPICYSMSDSDCCFLTCVQVSQEVSKVVWYSQLFKNFPQFVVIHTVKGFGIVNETEVDIFLKFSCFLMIQQMLAIWSLVPLPFLNLAWTSGSSQFTYCWSLAWRFWALLC